MHCISHCVCAVHYRVNKKEDIGFGANTNQINNDLYVHPY